MKALAVTIWVFINLVFFGMIGYMYLLWSQYFINGDKITETVTYSYDQQIYFYNRDIQPNTNVSLNNKHNETSSNKVVNDATNVNKNMRVKHALKENVTITVIKDSKPRFPNLQTEEFVMDSQRYKCEKMDSTNKCDLKTSEFKEKILNELKRVFMEESNVLKWGTDSLNPYGVQFKGSKGNHLNKPKDKLFCELKSVKLKTIKRSDAPFNRENLRDLVPKRRLFENKNFKSCAVIASSGSLTDSKLGRIIDAHDLVLRFNHAPTVGYEQDVGSKTTMRILNSQVVTKDKFKFLESPMYKNITLLAWDPSNYTASLEQWYQNPDFNLFKNYFEYRKKNAKSRFYLMNPRSLWDLWDFLQSNSPSMLRRNPPSSGFLGLSILLPHCDYVDIFEYVPSVRATKKCHYYDKDDNPSCTFGSWHPLAAEKLLAYTLNSASDYTVFQQGYLRIPGFKYYTNCY